MATPKNKIKLAALIKENCEEHPRRNLAQNSNVPRSQGDYITQVSEVIEGRVTKKLSQEFSRTENRILGRRQHKNKQKKTNNIIVMNLVTIKRSA